MKKKKKKNPKNLFVKKTASWKKLELKFARDAHTQFVKV